MSTSVPLIKVGVGERTN